MANRRNISVEKRYAFGKWIYAVITLGVLITMAACSTSKVLSREELAPVVNQEGIPFKAESIPVEIINRLAENQVIVIGESHMILEHRELVSELVRTLYDQGFRQLLLEWPNMADWLLSDFVEGTGLEPDWTPPLGLVGGETILAVRDFNRSLPVSDRVHVRAIDVNLDEYGGASSFQTMLHSLSLHLSDPGPIATFPASGYDTPAHQTNSLNQLQDELHSRQGNLETTWGPHWYSVITEMVEVELDSVSIRARRSSEYDQTSREREDVIKQIVDDRLEETQDKTLINVGNTHAQKAQLIGTSAEWLGDYLVHKSQAGKGSIFVISIMPAQIVSDGANPEQLFNLEDKSPENELWRVMHEAWPDQIVFLALDDAVFNTNEILMNFDGTIYEGVPKTQYDALVLLPMGHREPNP